MADMAHVQYTVTAQTKRSMPDGRGAYHDVWRVDYQTASGVDSHIEIPATEYTAQNVHAAIAQEMQHIDAVNVLGQGLSPQPPRT